MTIAYVITLLYLFCVFGEMMIIRWSDRNLAIIYGGVGAHWNPDAPQTRGLLAVAMLELDRPAACSVISAILIYMALSAANTSLYVASRTLYGLTYAPSAQAKPLIKYLGTLWHRNRVPMFALLVSALAFVWIPLLHLVCGYTIVNVGSALLSI